jgi:hypothetical protein
MTTRWVELRFDGKLVGKAQIKLEEGSTNYEIIRVLIEDPEANKELFSVDYSQFSLTSAETFSLDKE